MSAEIKKKYAFISYSHKDEKIAKWLQRRLESYKLPAEIHNEFENSRYLRPIFRDRSDLNTGILANELRTNLENSKYLIVICSPDSAKSSWVSEEVRTFIESGRLEYIIPFIVDGTPDSGTDAECFPASLCDYVSKHPEEVLLGIDIREDNREKAYIRLVSRMLGLSFDELWKRHERQRRNRIISVTLSLIALLFLLYWFAVPVKINVDLYDNPADLPAMRSAHLQVADQEYNIIDTEVNVGLTRPGFWRGRTIALMFDAIYYRRIDTVVHLGFGVSNKILLPLKRDDTFSIFAGTVIDDDGNPIAKACVILDDDYTCHTDEFGQFHFQIPLENQSLYKSVSVTKSGYKVFLRDEESPGSEIVYVLHQ